ncbi:hypothetical protein DE146DRAFT_631825 [Phaeosphaeria sp. MPI-PUGE-AT-0046c]|nr:hypothetical protein DE146DRAFT_631825 [Phaeosphaeria sp. MPI-PUGE-AT-0046c]
MSRSKLHPDRTALESHRTTSVKLAQAVGVTSHRLLSSSLETSIIKMNGMLTLVFTAVVAAAAGEIVQSDAGAQHSDACIPLSDLCTGPVVLQGIETQLTYVCPKTSELPTPSTVHVTITATTTVTIPGEISAESTAPVHPTHPAQPGPVPEEPTTTTTIHTTSTKLKTVTVTRKGSTSVTESSNIPVSAGATTLTETADPTWLITATSMFEIPTPNLPSFTFIPSTSSSAGSNHTYSFTLLPIPTLPRPSSTFWVPSVRPPIITSIPSSGFSIPSSANATSSRTTVDGFCSTCTLGTDGPSARVSGVAKPTLTYHFPTLHQIRDVNATTSAFTSAKPSETGGAGQMGVSFPALLCGVIAAAYLF